MQKIKYTYVCFILSIVSFIAVFHTIIPSTQVSAATIIRSSSAHITTYTAIPGSKLKAEIVMNNAIKKPKITSKSKKLKILIGQGIRRTDLWI